MRATFRPVIPFGLLVVLAGLLLLAAAGAWAEDGAVGDTRRHALLAVVAGLLAALVGARWHARLPAFGAVARLGLVGGLAFVAVAQLVEALGAVGEDDGWGEEIGRLGEVLTLAALAVLLAGLGLAGLYAFGRVGEWRRHPAQRS